MTEVSIAGSDGAQRPARNRLSGERYANGIYTRWRIVKRCRDLMEAGNFRPSVRDLVAKGVTKKGIRYHFETLADLYEAALDDVTAMAIAERALSGGRMRLALALVFGRLCT